MDDFNHDQLIRRLTKSAFRSRFQLKEQDFKYIDKKNLETIQQHAYDFVRKRLAPAKLINDGKQTPMKGHPVFIAQHATACCCRQCLYKWHHIPMGIELNEKQIDYIVSVIMEWIHREEKRNRNV